MIFQGHGELGGNLIQQRQVFGVKGVFPGAAEHKDA